MSTYEECKQDLGIIEEQVKSLSSVADSLLWLSRFIKDEAAREVLRSQAELDKIFYGGDDEAGYEIGKRMQAVVEQKDEMVAKIQEIVSWILTCQADKMEQGAALYRTGAAGLDDQ